MSENHIPSPQKKIDPSSSENPKKLQLFNEETTDENQSKGSPGLHDHEEEQMEELLFQTPTSSEHRIPTVQDCPSAPRKAPPKRKADDQLPQFVEEARGEEVDSFFQLNDAFVSERDSRVRSRFAKRRCRSI